MISNATGLNNITRYMEDVDNVLDNGLNIGIIMISLVNDKALRGMIGVVEYHKLLRCVSDKLVAMGQRLMSVIRKNEGMPNKDLERFSRDIQSLCDKWDRDDLS